MRTLRLTVQYEGTAYRGFSRQARGPTVQQELENALSSVLGERVRVVAAGRTDAGVHAEGQVVSFRTGSSISPEALTRAVNAHLPEDVAAREALEVSPEFHAQRSATARWYRYCIWRGRWRNVWHRRYSYHLSGPLDLDAMRRAAELLVGRHDFSAFVTGWGTDARPGRSTVRTVYRAEWAESGGLLYFDIIADGFLRQMVRGIVGTLLRVGRGKSSRDDFAALLAGAPRARAGPNAPARGLTLMGVEYSLPSGKEGD